MMISVVIPSRDRPSMLREAVESVVAQTHKDLEIIVVLTGATDAAKQSAHALQSEYGIRIVETPPLNLATTRNNGLAAAKGEWISFLDDDDIWLPTKLEKQLAANADVVTTNWLRFNERGIMDLWAPVGAPLPLPADLSLPETLMLQNRISVGSLIRVSALKKVGGFDPSLGACEDWDLWRRLSHSHSFAYLDEILMRVRIHANNMSKNRFLMSRTTAQHFIKMHRDTPPHLRHMLPRSRKALFLEIAGAIYESINDRTNGSARKAVRKIRSMSSGS